MIPLRKSLAVDDKMGGEGAVTLLERGKSFCRRKINQLIPPANGAVDVFSKKMAISLSPFFMIFKIEFNHLIGVAIFKKNIFQRESRTIEKVFKVFQKSPLKNKRKTR